MPNENRIQKEKVPEGSNQNSPKSLFVYSTYGASSANRRKYIIVPINGPEIKLMLDAGQYYPDFTENMEIFG